MRILMIAPTPFFASRGCHVRILEEARALKRLGHRVTIVTYHIGTTPKDMDVRRIPPLIFWYKKLEAGPSWWKLILDLLLLLKALSLLLSDHFDVIHAHLHEGCLIGYICNRLKIRRIPLLFDAQGSLTSEMLAHGFVREGTLLHRAIAHLERVIAGLPDVTIASNSTVSEELARVVGREAMVHVVHDGVRTDEFCPRPQPRPPSSALNVPEDCKVVVYLGLLTPYQGIDILLKAIPEVVARVPNAHFLIMGYPNEDTYREAAALLGLSDVVTFLGRVEYREAPYWLNLADVAVSPKLATTEANGKLLNYMATALPIAVFDTPTNRELLGDHAAYAKLGDASSLARAITWLLTDTQKAASLGMEARRRAVSLYSWARVAEQIATLYDACLRARCVYLPSPGRRNGAGSRH